ncbi:Imm1 family immunity protein [Amycolatopsis sp. OK19-0408]|uniref:Imm1 family immunity protein n=1 Tax=Amycolatopsis iheyensis TaxID=2945988 RepID=A0A9X2SIS7_9PSEU|nr:Imm1 family immunity protein [Amycolatopsis iheyensis]MCR6481555.1 Imm1 family immunity protein [Amycolatopsis iheyensis]
MPAAGVRTTLRKLSPAWQEPARYVIYDYMAHAREIPAGYQVTMDEVRRVARAFLETGVFRPDWSPIGPESSSPGEMFLDDTASEVRL